MNEKKRKDVDRRKEKNEKECRIWTKRNEMSMNFTCSWIVFNANEHPVWFKYQQTSLTFQVTGLREGGIGNDVGMRDWRSVIDVESSDGDG